MPKISDYGLLLTVIGLFLTAIALGLSVWQTLAARTQARDLDKVRRSLTTRFIGEFPDYLPEIVALVKRARKEVIIFCDFPTYGYFSDHSNWLNYRHAIDDKLNQDVKVSLTCPNKRRRLEFNKEQFAKEGEKWEAWRQEKKTIERLRMILPSHTEIADLTRDGFLKILENADQKMLKETFARAEKHEIDIFMPTFFWIADSNEAIFTFSTYSEDASEYGFYTLDQKLISALKNIRERYHRAKR